jgi:hypothetical protein
MNPLVRFILLVLIAVGSAPPPAKRLRFETCIAQSDLNKGPVTPCDDGPLESLYDVATMEVPRRDKWKLFGAPNAAQLMLNRCGIFDERLNSQELSICSKHRNELGTDWVLNTNNRPTTRKGTKDVLRCNVPADLHPRNTPYHTNYVSSQTSVTFKQSEAIWKQLLLFVPAGTGKLSAFEKEFKGSACSALKSQ